MLRVGTGRREITGQADYRLAGVAGRRGSSEGVHDPLQATALWVEDEGGQTVSLVGLDLVGLPIGWHERIPRSVGLSEASVVLCCSHTHSGPVSVGLLEEANAAYLSWLEMQVAEAIEEAARSAVDVDVELGSAACEIAVSRRLPFEGGCALRPNRRRQVDPEVTVVRFRGNGEEVARLVHFACHGTVLGQSNRLVSRDFFGYGTDAIEAEAGCMALFLQGACGDVRPCLTAGDHFREGTFGDAWALGRAMAAAAQRAAATALPIAVPRVECDLRRIALTLREPRGPERYRGEMASDTTAFWLREYERRWRAAAARVEIMVGVVDFGSLRLAWIPGEVFASTGHAIKQAGPRTLVVGYANGNAGYIPPPEALAEGGYEVNQAYRYYGYPSAYNDESEPLVRRTVIELLEGAEIRGAS